jgi:hypothetical protein
MNRTQSRRWLLAAGLLLLAGTMACAKDDPAQDCANLGGTYNESATPKCALPVQADAACAALGGTFNAAATPKCTLPSNLTYVTNSTTATNCNDAGGFPSTCATVTCPAGTKVVGGGGACSAGDRRIKSLFPRDSTNSFSIACEKQGVSPQVTAICLG